jgi:BirA family biotin operon repressor/biotin-[acetyl-CoA-carboxylase] ligase
MIIGSDLLFIENLPSTNTHTLGLLKKNDLKEGTIVYTNYQSAGKGYSGNEWESEDGKNLLISIVLYPYFIKPEDQFIISMTISLGICDFLERFIPICSIKWPNDIYVNNDKIAGILIESSVIGESIKSTVAGIGLNINQERFLGPAPNPISLRILTGINYDLNECLIQLGSSLDCRYKHLIAGDSSQIKKEYVSKLYCLNQWREFKELNGIWSGRLLDVGDYGRLRIEKKNGEISEYSFKEIEFIL